ncbi:MAG: hypothetical protein HFI09_02805 [Bacilli bacterium]|nr:hypothetical protein [Bacilli bacterium]
MNRNGQTLILFVIMIPIFLGIAALVIDLGILNNAKSKLEHTTDTILKEYYSKRMENNIKEEIKESFNKNKIATEHLGVEASSSSLKITNEETVKSIFGNLIGIEEYHIKTTKVIREKENKYYITKE